MSIADTVNEWFREHLACGPVARNTEAYNQAQGALAPLIAQLEALAAAELLPPDGGKTKAAKSAPADAAPTT